MPQAILTQNKLLAIARELSPGISWELTSVRPERYDARGNLDFQLSNYHQVYKSTVLAGDRYGAAYSGTDNELLGVNLLTEEERKKLIADRLG